MREGTRRSAAPVVVGMGAVSPAGLGVRPLWQTVVNGRVATGTVKRFDLAGYPSDQAGEVPEATIAQLDGIVPAHPSLAGRYLAAAALEALRRAGLDPANPAGRVGLFVGTVVGVRPILDRGIKRGGLSVNATTWGRPAGVLESLHEVVEVDGPTVLAAPGCSAGNS